MDTGRSRKPVRDPSMDNVRFLAVVLVVAGHAWEPLRDQRPVEAAHLLVYAFHVPVFVLVSGYLAADFTYTPAKVGRVLTGLLIPYLIFDAAYGAFAAAADPAMGDFTWTPLEPYYLTWFLLALAAWRLSAPVWTRLCRSLSGPAVIAVAVLVSGASGALALPSLLAIDRITAFLPFFVTGLVLRWKAPGLLSALRTPPAPPSRTGSPAGSTPNGSTGGAATANWGSPSSPVSPAGSPCSPAAPS